MKLATLAIVCVAAAAAVGLLLLASGTRAETASPPRARAVFAESTDGRPLDMDRRTLAHALAYIDQGLDGHRDDVLVARYHRRLKSLERKCRETEEEIAKGAIRTTELLAAGGVKRSCFDVIEAIDNSEFARTGRASFPLKATIYVANESADEGRAAEVLGVQAAKAERDPVADLRMKSVVETLSGCCIEDREEIERYLHTSSILLQSEGITESALSVGEWSVRLLAPRTTRVSFRQLVLAYVGGRKLGYSPDEVANMLRALPNLKAYLDGI